MRLPIRRPTRRQRLARTARTVDLVAFARGLQSLVDSAAGVRRPGRRTVAVVVGAGAAAGALAAGGRIFRRGRHEETFDYGAAADAAPTNGGSMAEPAATPAADGGSGDGRPAADAPASEAEPVIGNISRTPDEEAEVQAAAAEAAAIGGEVDPVAGLEHGETADEAERPVVEAGGGESEGQEQFEADLTDRIEGS